MFNQVSTHTKRSRPPRKINTSAELPSDLKTVLKNGVLVTFSFSTLDEEVAKIFEPGAPSPKDRLKALAKIKDAGFTAGIAFIPILPFITDSELETMVKTAKELGSDYVFFAPLTLYGEGKKIYLRIIEEKFPELSAKYNELYRDRFSPPKWYTSSFYKRVLYYTAKYNLKFGLIKIRIGL